MNRDSPLRVHLPGILLAATLLISVLFFLLMPPERIRRTFFFPGTTDLSVRSEYRLLPRSDSLEGDVRLLVEDMILGPMRIQHGRLLPRTTDVRSLMLQDGTLYIDLSAHVMEDDPAVRIPLDEALQVFSDTLIFNFRSLEDVMVTVDGQTPFEPAFRADPIGN